MEVKSKVRHFLEVWVLTENDSYAQVCRIWQITTPSPAYSRPVLSIALCALRIVPNALKSIVWARFHKSPYYLFPARPPSAARPGRISRHSLSRQWHRNAAPRALSRSSSLAAQRLRLGGPRRGENLLGCRFR